MNGERKWHKATGPAFHVGEEWVSHAGNIRCWIVSVRHYPGATGHHISDYGVTYRYADGQEHEKDAWNFQVRYGHVADTKLALRRKR